MQVIGTQGQKQEDTQISKKPSTINSIQSVQFGDGITRNFVRVPTFQFAEEDMVETPFLAFNKVGEFYCDFVFFVMRDGVLEEMSCQYLDPTFATNLLNGICFCPSSEILRGERVYKK
jgi:hypothetical protein